MSDSVIIDHILFFGRKYEEVLSMFALNEAKISDKRILDCNAGPGTLCAEGAKRGWDIIACDPLYAQSAEEIMAQGQADVDHFLERAKDHESATGKLDVEAFAAGKIEALRNFIDDYDSGKASGRYVPGALPKLPFDDASFDIVLSAHFLFVVSHPDVGGMVDSHEFDYAFHLASMRELLRVSRGEVRLYPTVKISQPGTLHPWMAQIIGELSRDGYELGFEANTYDQGRFTDHNVLVIRQ